MPGTVILSGADGRWQLEHGETTEELADGGRVQGDEEGGDQGTWVFVFLVFVFFFLFCGGVVVNRDEGWIFRFAIVERCYF